MSKAKNLKPCPLCGGSAVLEAFPEWSLTSGFYIRCDRCELALTSPGVHRPNWDSGALIAAWNHRIDQDGNNER